MPRITLLPDNLILEAAAGQTLHAVLAEAGRIDAPCGGQGTCGNCKVLVDGEEVLACRTPVHRDITVSIPQPEARTAPAAAGTRAAFDIGTTTVVCYLLDAQGNILSESSARNPQCSFGADVVSRIRAAQSGDGEAMTALIRRTMTDLLRRICRDPAEIEIICVVGNPAMQQLFWGLSVENLTQLPFAPVLCKPKIQSKPEIFPICPRAKLLTVPDISGFVGADTVAGILATGLPDTEGITLLVDIGTNGEMVLGSKQRMIACSTAAGPALEGANIQFGMRAEPGAIDRVWVENGALRCRVIGGGEAKGICGSGLIDAVAAAMDLGLLNRRGKILGDDKIMLTSKVALTQADIRQVQLAKGAIAAGIRLMAERLGIPLSGIQRVLLAGAFGTFLNPDSACRIGLIPRQLRPKITAVGNAAGQGAAMLAADPQKLTRTGEILAQAEFLELASLSAFPRTFAKAMELEEDWCRSAKAMGFSHAAAFDPGILVSREDVRAMCAADKCRAYGKNWTCPPHCGTTAQCEARLRTYRRGLLVQTVGQLSKPIDSRGYRETERRHLENFTVLCDALRRQYPDALCLGSGGCRVCKPCAYPQPCRFPEKAVSSMEGYGLFVTQVCRDAGLDYYHGEKTITYTACVLF